MNQNRNHATPFVRPLSAALWLILAAGAPLYADGMMNEHKGMMHDGMEAKGEMMEKREMMSGEKAMQPAMEGEGVSMHGEKGMGGMKPAMGKGM